MRSLDVLYDHLDFSLEFATFFLIVVAIVVVDIVLNSLIQTDILFIILQYFKLFHSP